MYFMIGLRFLGGPGGSGVRFLLGRGTSLQVIADSGARISAETPITNSKDKYFDIIGFDPRGVNNTTPALSCFPDLLAYQTWSALDWSIGSSMNDSEAAFQNIWAHHTAAGASCSELNKDVGRFVSTASVARDIIEIAEKHGAWRQAEAKRLVEQQHLNQIDQRRIYDRTAYRKDQEKVLYWGWSYGTFLGESLASMYPSRIGRMVLDAVIDPMAYIEWDYAEDIRDIDAIISYLATTCAEAGVEECPIYNADGPQAIQHNINKILHDIKARPIAQSTHRGPVVVKYDNVIQYIFTRTYFPMTGFSQIAQVLFDVARGNISTLIADLEHPSCSIFPGHPEREPSGASREVLCTDGDDLSNEPQDNFRSKVSQIEEGSGSKYFTELTASWLIGCYSYTTRAKWRFTGPFGGKTAHPILFASSTYDPVCPLHYAYRASSLFPFSAVVQSTGYGHSTLAQPSICVAKTVRAYFQTGVLPENGTLCEVDAKPFSKQTEIALDEPDQELFKATKSISEDWDVGRSRLSIV